MSHPSIECRCSDDLTCGYCLRNAPQYFNTPGTFSDYLRADMESDRIRVSIGIPNRFSLRSVSFQDLMRSNAQVLTLLEWDIIPAPAGTFDRIRAAFPRGVIIKFDVQS